MIFVRRLIWDAWNVAHIARHEVVSEEVEEVCHAGPFVSQTYGRRFRVVGPTRSGRMLTVILAPRGRGLYYPVTARPSSRKERDAYKKRAGGEKL